MRITEVTRQAILDELRLNNIWWAGRLDEPTLLARLYSLDEMPSYDRRYNNARDDIQQHRENNLDWDDEWIFADDRFGLDQSDEKLLQFLAMTVHPVVRPDRDEVHKIVDIYNRHLRMDGWELAEAAQISGRPVFAARSALTVPGTVRQITQHVAAGDMDYIAKQITRMETAVDNDPELAIGTAKELVETTCKTVLEAIGVQVEKKWDVPQLLRETTKQLQLAPDTVAATTAAADSIKRVLGSLGNIAVGVAELRNSYGTGHGKTNGTGGLGPRHARLVVGAASTLSVFLFETYNDRIERQKLAASNTP
ncbi:abortive infection family protein [Nocardia sp. CC201C]|uniref:abortive infection family protein n=1 Tax=Nocardia sp. CC201C TaxID=3044575 RepID=UPI0024A90193|nr:abortive infection family protein [Nocardia sp. CC201C]